MATTVGAVVLSMGNRPDELRAALESLLGQEGVDLDVLVVGNGWVPTDLPEGVRAHHCPDNVGIPQGRNVGAAHVRGEVLFFFDDDATLPQRDALARLVEHLAQDERLAVVQPRGADPTGAPAPRRWTPRLRVSSTHTPGEVVVFAEGVCCIRRSAFDEVGGWPGHFWYGHEGIDLAMRLIDADWRLFYDPSVVWLHPATAAARHAVFYRMNARNRVWVARRNLPWPLPALYVGSWVGITVARVRDRDNLRSWFGGLREGIREPAGQRHPISWRTVWRLTRAGRPPIL